MTFPEAMKSLPATLDLTRGGPRGTERPAQGAYHPAYPGYLYLNEDEILCDSSTGSPAVLNREMLDSGAWEVEDLKQLQLLAQKDKLSWAWRKPTVGSVGAIIAAFAVTFLLIAWSRS